MTQRNASSLSYRHLQRGLTMVELMVALTLSLLLLGGVIQIYASSKQSYRMNEALSRLQENGRFAIDFLTRDIRMAGFKGCAGYGPLTNTLQSNTTEPYKFDVGLEGFNDVSSSPPTYLSASGITPTAGTDVILFRRSVDSGVGIARNNSSAQVFAEVTSTVEGGCSDGTDKISGICEGDILLISDCQKSRVFQAGNISETSANPCSPEDKCLNITHPSSGTPGNDPSSWGGSSAPAEEQFGTDAKIFRSSSFAYYIDDGVSGPALFRKDGAGGGQELVEGVEDMQILYGEDTDGDDDRVANRYVPAGTAALDMDNVVSVRVSLLLRSVDDNITSQAVNYFYDSATRTPADRRLRRVFTATITLRNRAR